MAFCLVYNIRAKEIALNMIWTWLLS